jgi:uncharacterized protein
MIMLLAFLCGLAVIGVVAYLPLGERPVTGWRGPGAAPFTPLEKGAPEEAPGPKTAPRIAIVVDDLGYEPARDAAWLKFPTKLTMAVLPFGPSSRSVAEAARERGISVLLHVPMEPEAEVYDRTEEFRLRRGMGPDEMELLLDRMIHDVPFASGASNHMGSAFTADPGAMSIYAALLKERGLFLLDSVTTPRSVAVTAALRAGVPAFRRDVVLDLDESAESMRRRWAEALSIAKRKGFAVLVCHARTETLRAIRGYLPELKAEGIRAVTLDELLAEGG